MKSAYQFAVIALVALIAVLCIQLWVGEASIPGLFRVRSQINDALDQQAFLTERNAQLSAQVQSLKGASTDELEARARAEIGMIKPGEMFYLAP